MNTEDQSDELARRILEIVKSPNYHPKKPKWLLKTLGLGPDEKPLVRRIVKKLVATGQLVYGANHLVYPGTAGVSPASDRRDACGPKDSAPQSQRSWVVGSFRRSASGAGFVRPRENEVSSKSQHKEVLDIFIPPHLTKDATTGDLVAVEIFSRKPSKDRFDYEPRKKRGRRDARDPKGDDRGPKGKIVEIVERASQRFVGTYFEDRDWGYVQVDGNTFREAILVGDPSANAAQPDDKVVIEMLRFPSPYQEGEAVVVEVLGSHGVPGLDTLIIMKEYNLPDNFSEAALRNARDQVVAFFKEMPDEETLGTAGVSPASGFVGVSPASVSASGRRDACGPLAAYLESVGRVDLTQKQIITIDPPDARDFDDAISLEELDNGHLLLGVHIADVAHFVPEGSAVDLEARDRATSVYLPDRVIPMIPEVISNALASLQPHKVRLTNSVFMEFTPEGIRCNTDIQKSAIRSVARLNYEEVQEFFEWNAGAPPASVRSDTVCIVFSPHSNAGETPANPGAGETPTLPGTPALQKLLLEMLDFSRILRLRRKKRGALEMDMPDVKIDLDEDGRVIGAHAEIQTEAHKLIEEFMLSANEAVAEFLHVKKIPFLRRIHKYPSYRKMKDFADFLRSMKLDDLEPEELLESRFTIQRILEKTKGTELESAVQFSLLRSMQQAVYSPQEEGHFALASPCYTHFTSPIRRYPDLTIHRLLNDYLRDPKRSDKKKDESYSLNLLGVHCSERERRAETAERELIKLKLIDYMSRNIGLQMEAVITGMSQAGIFVQGIEIPAEGLVPMVSLTDDTYRFDRLTRTLTGRRNRRPFRLGGHLTVEVVRADPDDRQIDFRIVGPHFS